MCLVREKGTPIETTPPPRRIALLVCFGSKKLEEEGPSLEKYQPQWMFFPLGFLFLLSLQIETCQKEDPPGGGGFFRSN